MIVFGFMLMLVGITAVAQAATVSSRLSTELLNAAVGSDAATVRGFVNAYLTPDDLAGPRLTRQRQARLQDLLATLAERGGILRAEIRLTDGSILASNQPQLNTLIVPPTSSFTKTVEDAAVSAAIVAEGQPTEAAGPQLDSPRVLRAYLPVIADGAVQAVFAIWRDARPLLAKVDALRLEVLLIVCGAGAVASLVLFFIFRAAQRRITTQTQRLIEAERRDPLTDTPNHGALVALLGGRLEQARREGRSVSVALLDIDNFRLLNDTQGYDAGNLALRKLAELLGADASGIDFGRYGPDEFLLISDSGDDGNLEHAVHALRALLAELWLALDGEERLPITFSAGICSFPKNGGSITALLSTAANTLEEAKAGGGDAVRVAGNRQEQDDGAASFDVLQGLVIAIDTKDRYTKRHSEDVARYGTILARLMGLDTGMIETIRRAGLLHDIGKIAIPDAILRKPGRLTEDEAHVVKQHVALGHMIVRDLPNFELVREGVRHHHERWDGTGYLDALTGEETPLIGRILAVADAFSAMTTTRPYRKGLEMAEALKRLGDAAGTQLDARLVQAFVAGLDGAAQEDLVGVLSSGGAPLWVTDAQVA